MLISEGKKISKCEESKKDGSYQINIDDYYEGAHQRVNKRLVSDETYEYSYTTKAYDTNNLFNELRQMIITSTLNPMNDVNYFNIKQDDVNNKIVLTGYKVELNTETNTYELSFVSTEFVLDNDDKVVSFNIYMTLDGAESRFTMQLSELTEEEFSAEYNTFKAEFDEYKTQCNS